MDSAPPAAAAQWPPAPPPPPYPAMAPPGYPYWPGAPPVTNNNRRFVRWAIAGAVLIILVPIILAAVLYVMVTGL